MSIFKFTSPEGTDYYGEGSSPQEAFATAEEREPHELAAMRTRQSVRHGAPAPQIDIPEAATAAKRGEYGPLIESAGESVAALGSMAAPGLSALGQAIAPTAIAESMFAAETDTAKRRALERQYRDLNPKGQRELLAQFNAQQSKIAEEQRTAARDIEARGLTKQQREDWFAQNEESIKSLKPQWQQQIQAAGSLPEAQEMFNRGMEERRQAGMTVSERHPELVGALEGAGMLGAAYIPGKLAAGRSRAIKEATEEAENSFRAAFGPGAKRNKGTRDEAALSENILRQVNQMWQFSPTEVIGGVAAPWIAGQAPNFYDWTMGQLDSDPAAQEKVKRARDNILSLGPVERALIEGGAASFLGTWLGSGRRDWGATKARSQGVLDTFESRRTAEETASAKRATSRAAPKPPVRVINMPSAEQLAATDVLAAGSDALRPRRARALK